MQKRNIRKKNIDNPELICKKEGAQEIHDVTLKNILESGILIENFIQ